MMDPIRNALFTAKRRRHFDEGGGTAVTAEKKVENVQAKNAEPNYGNIVTSAYENVGRKGFGSEASNIDQPGYDYWVNQLQSGAVKPEDFNTTFAQAAKQSNQTTAADQGQQWKTWFGYAPTQADYDKMLRVALGEAGVNTYDQYRGIYEATGNRLASGAYGSDTMAGLITPKQMAGITRTDAINDLMTSNDPTKQKAYQTAQQALNDYLTEGQNKVLTTQTDWRGFQGGKPSPGTNFENALAPGSQGSAMYNKFYDAENNPSVADKLAGLLAEKGGIYTYNPYTATYAQDVLNKEAQLAQEETGGIAGIQQAGLDFQSQQDAINAAQQNAVQQAQNFDTGIVQNAATDFNYLNPLQNTGIGDWTNMYTGVDYTNPSVGAYTPSVTDFSYNAFDNYTPWSLENRGGRTMAVGGAAPYVPPRKDNWIDRTDKELQKQSMTPEQEDETAEKLERLQDKSKQDRRMFAHGGDPVEHALRLARGGYATEGFVDEPDAAPGESVLLREAVTPRSLAQSWTPPEEAIAAKSPIAAEFMEQYPQRMGEAVVQTVKYPGQLLYGEKSFDPEEAADWANTAAGIAMTGGVGAAALYPSTAKEMSSTARIFAGPAAKTANHEAFDRALWLSDHNQATPKEIFKETGWFQGADGKWRFEIPDVKSKLTDDVFKNIKEKGIHEGPMHTALEHQELYAAYPELSEMNAAFGAKATPRGSYSPHTKDIIVEGPSTVSQRSTALHELQHAVQQIEGFARGANNIYLKPNTPAWDIYQERLKAIKNPMTKKQFEKSGAGSPEYSYEEYLKQTKDSIKNNWPMLDRAAQDYSVQEAYRRSAGEVEARNVQSRRNLDPSFLRKELPWETQSVPNKQQLIQFHDPEIINKAKGGATQFGPDAAQSAVRISKQQAGRR